MGLMAPFWLVPTRSRYNFLRVVGRPGSGIVGTMTMQAKAGIGALTDREKQTLRLIVRGHDAKSIARELNLSVHTINERLRDARRKLAVSSSREAARMLLEVEGDASLPTPDYVGDKRIGEDRPEPMRDESPTPIVGVETGIRRPRIIIGAILMTLALSLLALGGLTHMASTPPQTATTTATDPAVVEAAQHFLQLIDQGRWADSYRLTTSSFHKLNTEQVWAATSEKVRTPLGKTVSRTLLSQDDVPAPPAGYRMVRFNTRFGNSAAVVETVTLERENGEWRVAGIYVG
jgi:DNA-binding CsgD family transcriptional regulator